MVETSRIQSLRVVASLINSGGDLATVLQRLVLAACRHANWSMGSIMAVDVEHGYALVVVRHDPTLIQRPLPDRWELATSPSLVALRRNEPVFIPDARVSEEFPGYRREAFERDYHSVLVVPMNCTDDSGRPLVLSVVSRGIVEVSEEDLTFIGMIVQLGEIAVERQHRLRAESLAAERLQRALEVNTSLLRQALEDGAMATLLPLIRDLLPYSIVIVDFTANLVTADRAPCGSDIGDADWQAAVASSLGPSIMKAARDAIDHPAAGEATVFWDVGGKRIRTAPRIDPLTADGEVVGALMIFPGPQPYGQSDQLLLDGIMHALSIQMLRNVIRFRYENRTLTDLFLELVERRWRDHRDIGERALRLGLNLDLPTQMIVVGLPGRSPRAVSAAADLHLPVQRLLAPSGVAGTLVTVPAGLVCLIPAVDERSQGPVKRLMAQIARSVADILHAEPFVVLTSRCTAPPDYAEAWERSWRMIRIADEFGRPGVLDARQFGPLPMLLAAANTHEVRGYVADSIGALVEYDRRHGTPYLETLSAYLKTGCRTKACSDQLGVHVTTLRYRLTRITELFGIDVESPERRFSVELAIHLSGVIDQAN
ncbi:helix-turn-helix domain-containing protein (plasmid) [Azospirillum oryzae]|uniref:Helix-turn-helix domain-containing protein n=1 Tax=Azospirillum oryzae TaxID=286727 RepID=A0A6N1AQY4_9PROT|nr:helix-turn-helix domain-containing protein [Azospirillum oryzae]KAA0587431.1 GAF domain-containing protein [Azospirillum oryzae]QKS50512.1 helix-turn-helix domain-containing protein [Azospirillum oryzae]GLR78770.1 PucR family transcriptional regulator [Azospirillum oryzae]